MGRNGRLFLVLATVGSALIGAHGASAGCTVPNQLANGQVADAAQVMANFSALANCAGTVSPAGAANAIQYNAGGGAFGGVAPMTNGQVVIGTTGGIPQAATLTAGAGIAVLNTPGGITVAATGGGGGAGSGVDWLNAAAVIRPNVADFALQTTTTPPGGAALTDTVRGLVLASTGGADGSAMMAEATAPSGPWQATMLAVYSGPLTAYSFPTIAVRDPVNKRAVELGIGGAGPGTYRFDYSKSVDGAGLDTNLGDTTFQDIGMPPPSQPVWSRLTYDGTNLSWAFSRDGEFFVTAFTVAANDSLTNLTRVGPAALFRQPVNANWPSAYLILSWNLVSL